MVMYIGGQKVSPIIKVGEINNQDKTITENGTYTADAGYTGLGEVTVNVPSEQPLITELNVTPTTSAQTIVAPTGTDGYSPVKVSAVTSSIDDNIIAGNIKKDVTILGVTGTLEEGITPTGTISITENGTVDVTNYANAEVNVSELGIPREVSANGVYQIPVTPFIFSLPSNATDVGDKAMGRAFQDCPSLSSINFSSLTTVSGDSAMQSAFAGCSNLTNVDLSNLTTVSGNYAMESAFVGCSKLTNVDWSSLTTVSGNYAMGRAFQDCPSLSSINFSSLTTVSGNSAMQSAFAGCSNLTNVDLSNLTTISGDSAMQSAFVGCSKLTNVDWSSLTTVSGNYAMHSAFVGCSSLSSINFSSLTTVSGNSAMHSAFVGCSSLSSLSFPSLTSISFGAYTNQFNRMLLGVTGCMVHFPSNLQSVIGSWSDVTNGFGGENTTVLFDLPATT